MTTGKKILIVDDEQDIATYLRTILDTSGFSSTVAADAETALELAEKLRPDLICLDIMMPRESGITMYERLRNHGDLKDTPVMIISGLGQNGTFDFRRYVPDRSIPEPEFFMEKPIDVDQFIKAVARLAGSRRPPMRGGN